MSYENTVVAVSKSQEGVRRLVMSHKGFGIAFVSDRDPEGQSPSREGFEAKVIINGQPTVVRIMCKLEKQMSERATEKEERRVWRVLYWHVKAVFEAADSGVMEFRELMLPFIVTPDGKTVSEHLIPRLDKGIDPSRLLTDGKLN